jgi:hypothetical protein
MSTTEIIVDYSFNKCKDGVPTDEALHAYQALQRYGVAKAETHCMGIFRAARLELHTNFLLCVVIIVVSVEN